MQTRRSFIRPAAFLGAAVLVAGCSRDGAAPTGPARSVPHISAATLAPIAPGTAITLDQQNAR